jgi:hypothetical protein
VSDTQCVVGAVVGVLALAALGLAALALMVLTAIGSHRRGSGVPVAVLSGIFFPMAWVVWYARDELPRGDRRPSAN